MALLKIKSLESSNTLLTHIGYKLKICHNSKKTHIWQKKKKYPTKQKKKKKKKKLPTNWRTI
jgi:hypothetical protein